MIKPPPNSGRLVVHLPGSPVGQPRGRHVPAGKGRVRVVAVTDPAIAAYQTRLEEAMRQAADEQGWEVTDAPLGVWITAYFSTRHRDRWGLYCGKKPDGDNVSKSIWDCASRAGLIYRKRDERVAEGGVRKVWAPTGGVVAVFRSLEGVRAPEEPDDDLGAF